MTTVREQNIQSAKDEVAKGVPLRVAAGNWGVPPATLSDRMHGRESMKVAKITAQRLSPAQESFVAQWALAQEAVGRPRSRVQIAGFASQILLEAGDEDGVGARWIDRFLKRNPEVKTKNSVLLDSERAAGSTREAYEKFYSHLREQVTRRNITTPHITNMDEHGMQEMETNAGKVIGDACTSKAIQISSDDTTWVSVIEAGTADGRRLKPVVIFTGASLQGQWYPSGFRYEEDLPGWEYDYSPTGWSNARIALKWLNEAYLPETKPSNPNQWRLLILNEHASHLTDEFQLIAFKNKVQLVYLPPHTSHKTQPLNRSVFGAVKTYFRQKTRELAAHTASAPVNKRRFLLAYRDASKEGMRARNVISGFRNTGIWPIRPEMVLDDPTAILNEEEEPRVPSTPKIQRSIVKNTIIKTPQGSQAIREGLQTAREFVSPTNRANRALLAKAGEALDAKNAEIAYLKAKISEMEKDIDAAKPRSKKKVKIDGNDKFAGTEAIAEAQEASERPPKRRRGGRQPNPEPVVEEVERVLNNDLRRLRQIQEM